MPYHSPFIICAVLTEVTFEFFHISVSRLVMFQDCYFCISVVLTEVTFEVSSICVSRLAMLNEYRLSNCGVMAEVTLPTLVGLGSLRTLQ